MSQMTDLTAAIRYQEAGDFARAKALFRQLVQAAPDTGEAWYRLGAIAWQQQQFDEARFCFEKCLMVTPNHAPAAKSLGGVLAQLGQFEAAWDAFCQALRINPDDIESLINAGAMSGQLGRLEETETALRRALALQPHNARAHYNLGVTLEKQGQHDEALICYQQAAQYQPANAQIYYNQGIALKNLQRSAEAVACFEKVLQLDPLHLDALATLGAIYGEQGQHEQAMACFAHVLEQQPDHIGARFNQAVVLAAQNQTVAAMASYQQILKNNPGHLGATINLGGQFLSQRNYEEAAVCFRRAIAIDAASPEAHYGLWLTLFLQDDAETGLIHLRRAVTLQPDNAFWRLERDMIVPSIMPDETTIEDARKYLNAILENYPPGSIQLEQRLAQYQISNANPSFALVYHGKNDRSLKERFAAIFAAPYSPEKKAASRHQSDSQRYRVGFLVGKDHEVGFNCFISDIINHLNPALFKPVVLCDARIVSVIRAKLTHTNVEFVAFASNIQTTAARLAALDLDLIYFWEIGTDAINYFLPFFRLAPVQCTSWGTPDTTGIPQVDYFVSSVLFEPETAAAHYSEQLVRLQTLGVYYRRPQLKHRFKERTYFGWSDRDRIYFCTQNLLKYHPEFDWLLAEILRRDDRGRILVKSKQQYLNDALRQRWQKRIPDVIDRIEFVPQQSYEAYLNLMQAADVLLDTIHYSGGTTSFEAIAVGTPIVTWPGEFMRGRMTYGCYQKIGVLDTVVWSAAEYVAKAVQIATDRSYQQHLRQKILAAGDALFADVAAVRELEQFFVWAIEKARSEAKNG